jgi:hypothetical protein
MPVGDRMRFWFREADPRDTRGQPTHRKSLCLGVPLEETNKDIISCARRAMMEDAGAQVMDLIFGRWRYQILYVGVTLGVCDVLTDGPQSAVSQDGVGPLGVTGGKPRERRFWES